MLKKIIVMIVTLMVTSVAFGQIRLETSSGRFWFIDTGADTTEVQVMADGSFLFKGTTVQPTIVVLDTLTTAQRDALTPRSGALIYNTTTGNIEGYDGTWTNMGAAGASATFIGLTDTPSSFSGQGLMGVRVNSGANALEFYTITTGGEWENHTTFLKPNDAAIVALHLPDTAEDDSLIVAIDGSGNITFTTTTGNITWVTGNTGDASFVLPNQSISGAEMVSGTVSSLQIGTDAVSSDELDALGVEADLEAVMDLQDMQGAITDGQVPNSITIDLATLATTLTITDNEATAETNAVLFTAGGDLDGGNLGIESDGDLTYTPNTGTLAATTVTGANITSGSNPGHTHTGSSLSSIDISDDTNLTAGTNITLTDDNLSVDADLLTMNDITFVTGNSPSYTEGLLFYDDGDGALGFYNDESDITLQIGQEEYIRSRNETGSTITNGQCVYISGNDVGTGLPLISLAQADAASTSRGVVGLATHDIENNSNGYVTIIGRVNGLNTSAFSNGDPLWLSASTAGDLTATEPSLPNKSMFIGIVVRANAAIGVIVVALGATSQGLFTDTNIAIGQSDGSLGEDSGITYTNATDILNLGGGIDAIGAVDLDYGSADVTDHTFIADGTTDSDFVVPLTSISGSEIVNDTITSTQLSDGSATGIIDTLTAAWVLADTVIVEDLGGWKVPVDLTIVEVGGYTDANTTTFNFEVRAAATPNTSGTDVLAADLVADTNQQVNTTISSGNADRGDWVMPDVSATGDVNQLTMYFLYVRR